jgi:hypothetical protein
MGSRQRALRVFFEANFVAMLELASQQIHLQSQLSKWMPRDDLAYPSRRFFGIFCNHVICDSANYTFASQFPWSSCDIDPNLTKLYATYAGTKYDYHLHRGQSASNTSFQ